jgi:hypothetical protein
LTFCQIPNLQIHATSLASLGGADECVRPYVSHLQSLSKCRCHSTLRKLPDLDDEDGS